MKVEGRRAHLSHASEPTDRCATAPCDWKAGSNRIQSAGWSAASPSIVGKERMYFYNLERKFKLSNFFLKEGHSDPERMLQ
jgi:hypothetical protein